MDMSYGEEPSNLSSEEKMRPLGSFVYMLYSVPPDPSD